MKDGLSKGRLMFRSLFPASQLPVLLFVASIAINASDVSGQVAPGHFWLAGRYDGNRVIVYFDAVQFGANHPPNEGAIPPPVAPGFFNPVSLSSKFVARVLQRVTGAEVFHTGEQYELLLGHGQKATITLTTLVGFEGDEGVGNDSYIGALGTLDQQDAMFAVPNYSVVRRASIAVGETSKAGNPIALSAGLQSAPVRSDIEAQIAKQLSQRWKTLSTDATPPAIAVQPFRLADGSLRYYVRAQWGSEAEHGNRLQYALGAWMTPAPLRILAVEHQTSNYGFENVLPVLLNVVDLGHGKTGLIVSSQGEDSTSLRLTEYREGASLAQMRILQAINAAE